MHKNPGAVRNISHQLMIFFHHQVIQKYRWVNYHFEHYRQYCRTPFFTAKALRCIRSIFSYRLEHFLQVSFNFVIFMLLQMGHSFFFLHHSKKHLGCSKCPHSNSRLGLSPRHITQSYSALCSLSESVHLTS